MTGIGSSNQHLQTSHTLRGQQLGLAMDVADPDELRLMPLHAICKRVHNIFVEAISNL